MLHRYLAGAFIFFIVPFVLIAWRKRGEAPWAGRAAVTVAALYGGQVLVGALNVWFTFPEPLTITHTVIASLVWFTLASVIIIDYYRPAVRERGMVRSGREAPA